MADGESPCSRRLGRTFAAWSRNSSRNCGLHIERGQGVIIEQATGPPSHLLALTRSGSRTPQRPDGVIEIPVDFTRALHPPQGPAAVHLHIHRAEVGPALVYRPRRAVSVGGPYSSAARERHPQRRQRLRHLHHRPRRHLSAYGLLWLWQDFRSRRSSLCNGRSMGTAHLLSCRAGVRARSVPVRRAASRSRGWCLQAAGIARSRRSRA